VGFLDRLLGIEPRGQNVTQPITNPPLQRPPEGSEAPEGQITDRQALERYRYMIKTAPPETIEQAHTEAFARLTPAQRSMILAELANAQPSAERAAAQRISPNDPQAMGQLATRTEMRQPGFMERVLGRGGAVGGGGGGGGGMGFGTSLLTSFAMGFAGSMIANSFFHSLEGGGGVFGGGHQDADAAADTNNAIDQTDDPADTETDVADESGGDDFGGGGDDFGGGDFDV
jgi:hypothetical protein